MPYFRLAPGVLICCITWWPYSILPIEFCSFEIEKPELIFCSSLHSHFHTKLLHSQEKEIFLSDSIKTDVEKSIKIEFIVKDCFCLKTHFPQSRGCRGWFQDDSSALSYIYCALYFYYYYISSTSDHQTFYQPSFYPDPFILSKIFMKHN